MSEDGTTNQMRDMFIRSQPDMAGLVMARDHIAEKWCRENGKDKNDLSIEDIIAIRSQPEWENPG